MDKQMEWNITHVHDGIQLKHSYDVATKPIKCCWQQIDLQIIHKTMNLIQQQFCNTHNLTETKFFGKEPIESYLDLSSLTSIPNGFNPTVGGSLYLSSLTSIPDGFNPTVGGSLYLRSLTSISEGFNPTVGDSLYLDSLTSIPNGFNPTVGGSLDLFSLTCIPNGFNPTVGGYLDLSSLTCIPVGFNPIVGGWLNLRNITSIPDGFNPTVGGSLYLYSLTSIPDGFNPTVGMSLNLNNLNSIPDGFNPTVGGSLYLSSLTRIPEGFDKSKLEHQSIPLIQWDTPRGRFIKCDEQFSQVVSHRGNLWRLKDIGKDSIYYLIGDGNGNFAHGDTIEEAKTDLLFKTTKRDKSEYVGLDMDEKRSFEDCVIMYRVITGACSNGIKNFLLSNGIEQKPYSIKEIITVTDGQYGNEEFKKFFCPLNNPLIQLFSYKNEKNKIDTKKIMLSTT